MSNPFLSVGIVGPETEGLLRINGLDDCNRGIDCNVGWGEIAELLGIDPRVRTPAKEAYLDGYYSGKFNSMPLEKK